MAEGSSEGVWELVMLFFSDMVVVVWMGLMDCGVRWKGEGEGDGGRVG